MKRLIPLLPLLACAVLCLGALPPRLEIRETHDGRPFTLSLTPRRAESGCEVYAFSFPSPVRSGSAANDVVSGELFRPLRPVRGRQHPAALVFHIIGPGDFFLLERQQCRTLAEHGVTALYFHLPFYGRRGGADGPYAMLTSPALFRQSLSQALADTRRAVDVLLSFPDVSPAKLGAVGVSLGSLMAANALAADTRLTRGMMILGGGDLPAIINNQVPETRAIRRFLAAMPEPQRFAFVQELLAYDPLTLAPRLRHLARQGRLRMINAERDQVIPPDCSRKLAERLGCTPLWLPGADHYSFVGQGATVIREMTALLAADTPRDWRPPTPEQPLEHRLLTRLADLLARLLGERPPQPGTAHLLTGAVTLNLLGKLPLRLPFALRLGPRPLFRLDLGPHGRELLSAGQDTASLWCADPGRLYEIPAAQLRGATLLDNPLLTDDDTRLLRAALKATHLGHELCNDLLDYSAQTAPDGRQTLRLSCRTETIPIIAETIPNTCFAAFDPNGSLKRLDLSLDGLSASIDIHRWQPDAHADAADFLPPIRATRLPLPADGPFRAILNRILPLLPVVTTRQPPPRRQTTPHTPPQPSHHTTPRKEPRP